MVQKFLRFNGLYLNFEFSDLSVRKLLFISLFLSENVKVFVLTYLRTVLGLFLSENFDIFIYTLQKTNFSVLNV